MFKTKGFKWFARLYYIRCITWVADNGEAVRAMQTFEETICKEAYEFLHPELLTFDKVNTTSSLPRSLLSISRSDSLSLSPLLAHINNNYQKWLAEDWQNLQREGPLSFSSALFSKEFCDLLTEEVLNIKRQCRLVKLVLFIPFLLLPLILILLNNNTDNDGSVS